MAKPRLLITSIFAPSEWNRSWFSLQKRYVAEMTRDVTTDYRIYLNGVDPDSFGEPVAVVGRSPSNEGHSIALRAVVDLFRRSEYDYYLILDSDCFPVHEHWFSVLTAQMAQFRKKFAAPVRTENLDLFPHPSAFFMTGGAVHDRRIDFELGHLERNLLDDPVTDVGTAMVELMPDVLPLLRTNLRNIHPIACAVYHHVFYHHGSGSREVRFRLTNRYEYCRHWWDSSRDQEICDAYTQQLFADPRRFLAFLMEYQEPLQSGF
jgi:hypothetical protein